jgi:hypothetical protein
MIKVRRWYSMAECGELWSFKLPVLLRSALCSFPNRAISTSLRLHPGKVASSHVNASHKPRPCPSIIYTPDALLALPITRSACEGCGGWARYGYSRVFRVKTTTRQSLLSPERWLFDEGSGSTLLIVGRCEVTVTLKLHIIT